MTHTALFYFPTFWHPLSGNGYMLWSGITGSTSIFAVFLVVYRKMDCHEPGCWRIGKHSVDGTPYVTCHRHHPGLEGSRVKRGHIHAAHTLLRPEAAAPNHRQKGHVHMITVEFTEQEAQQVVAAIPASGEEFPGYGEASEERKEEVAAAISAREKVETALAPRFEV